MRTRYFDNAATSFPKPPEVAAAVIRAMTEIGAPARGSHAPARQMQRLIRQCRERIARLVNLSSPEHVVFGYNTTDALNLAVKGVLADARRRKPGKKLHVAITHMEHNSILRPLNTLMETDSLIECTRVQADAEGFIDPADIRSAIKPGETVLVCINHASNVTGTVQDMSEIGRVCAEFGAGTDNPDGRGLLLLLDGAQSLGHVQVDMQALHVDLLAIPGHKGLLGPQGTGGLCIRPGVEHRLASVREGGTGSSSEQETHPAMMPEKYEPGSHNAAGIAGLSEGVAWLLQRGLDKPDGGEVRAYELALMRRFLDGLNAERTPGMRLIGPRDPARRVAVFSLVHDSLSSAELAAILETEYGILSRAGLHCAPLAHKSFGTAATGGALRLSFGPFLSESDIDFALDALAAICKEHVHSV